MDNYKKSELAKNPLICPFCRIPYQRFGASVYQFCNTCDKQPERQTSRPERQTNPPAEQQIPEQQQVSVQEEKPQVRLQRAFVYEENPPREAPRFRVAEVSRWCSVYFDGLRRPCTLPSALWEELLEPENLERFRQFLEKNRHLFKNKKT